MSRRSSLVKARVCRDCKDTKALYVGIEPNRNCFKSQRVQFEPKIRRQRKEPRSTVDSSIEANSVTMQFAAGNCVTVYLRRVHAEDTDEYFVVGSCVEVVGDGAARDCQRYRGPISSGL